MKVVCISGSPKPNGNTSAILSQIAHGLRNQNIEVIHYDLHRSNINYCCGCKSCYNSGKCVFDDDVPKIANSIFSSQLVIVASPSYWGDVTGQMKVFIDRCTPYSNTNNARHPVLSGIKGVAVAVRAGQSKQENMNIVHTIEHFLGHLDIPLVSYFTVEGIGSEDDLRSNQVTLLDAYNFGEKLYSLINQK